MGVLRVKLSKSGFVCEYRSYLLQRKSSVKFKLLKNNLKKLCASGEYKIFTIGIQHFEIVLFTQTSKL